MPSKARPRWLGIGVGTLAVVVFGLVYLVILHEPGSAFYPFAALAFLGGPIVAGIVAGSKTPERRLRAILTSSGIVFGVACGLFVFAYGVLPQFDRANVLLTASCDGFDGTFNPPARLTYTLPDGNVGILIVSDEGTAVVATVDVQNPPYPTTVLIIDKADNRTLQSMTFQNDVVSAAIGRGAVYIYNDKLGFFFDAHTGNLQDNIFTIDNYGGLTQTDRPVVSQASSDSWYLETTAVISSWNANGTVVSRPHLTFNGIARGCYISGSTHEVVRY
jgi:hypothetical protein